MLGRNVFLAASAALVVSFFSLAQACEGLLADGVYASLSTDFGSYSSSDIKSAFCSESAKVERSSRSFGGGATFVVKGIPIGTDFDTATQRLSAYREAFCRKDSSSTVSSESQTTLSRWADPNLLSAYIQCQALQNKGLKFTHELNSERSILSISVESTVDSLSNHIWEDIQVFPRSAAECSSPNIEPGERIQNRRYSLSCFRADEDGGRAALIKVTSSLGTFSAELPALAPNQTRSSLVDAINSLQAENDTLESNLRSTQSSLSSEQSRIRSLLSDYDELKDYASRKASFYSLYPCNNGAAASNPNSCRFKMSDACRRAGFRPGDHFNPKCDSPGSPNCRADYNCLPNLP